MTDLSDRPAAALSRRGLFQSAGAMALGVTLAGTAAAQQAAPAQQATRTQPGYGDYPPPPPLPDQPIAPR